jgi:3-oxoacyl-(acyl-carrier-protein) synthase
MSTDPSKRVVVTGYGIHAAIDGVDDIIKLGENYENRLSLLELTREAGAIHCVGVAGKMEPPFPYLPQRKWLKYMGQQTQLSVWAAGKALEDAKLLGSCNDALRAEMGLLLATGPIAFELSDVIPAVVASRREDSTLDFEALGEVGLRSSSPMMPFHTLLNMPIGLVSMIFGIKGHNSIYYPDAEQALFAISSACRAIEHGRLSMALVGGTAQLLSLMPIVNHARRGLIARTPVLAQPFQKGHHGLGLSDAASMLVLESEEHARVRGARIYGKIEAEAIALSTRELLDGKRPASASHSLSIASGTVTDEQDAEAIKVANSKDCLSFDAVTGYVGPAALALNLGIACRILERKGGYRQGLDCDGTNPIKTVEILALSHTFGDSRWSRVTLGALS